MSISNVSSLPPPPGALVCSGDAETIMAAAAMSIQDTQLGTAQRQAEKLSGERDAALTKARAALEAARRAEKDSGFWGSLAGDLAQVAQVAGVVASAAAIGTGVGAPAGLAIAACALSTGAFVMQQTGADGKAFTIHVGGKALDVNWSDVVNAAAIACSAGASATSTAAEEAGKRSAAEASKRAAADAARAACQSIQIGALGVQGGATAGRAYCTYEAGVRRADAVTSFADSRAAKNDAARAGDQLEEQIDTMTGIAASRKRLMDIVDAITEEKAAMQRKLTELRA
jgi:hypothetical protein